jgi:hypothetical protein
MVEATMEAEITSRAIAGMEGVVEVVVAVGVEGKGTEVGAVRCSALLCSTRRMHPTQ